MVRERDMEEIKKIAITKTPRRRIIGKHGVRKSKDNCAWEYLDRLINSNKISTVIVNRDSEQDAHRAICNR